MKLVPVDKFKYSVPILYDLLAERTPEESISHKVMPTKAQHTHFVENHPYEAWYLIQIEQSIVGSVYITKARELGISVFKAARGHGYAKEALRIIMNKHPGLFLANINPMNEASATLFSKLGFHLIQHTYAR